MSDGINSVRDDGFWYFMIIIIMIMILITTIMSSCTRGQRTDNIIIGDRWSADYVKSVTEKTKLKRDLSYDNVTMINVCPNAAK